MYLLEVYPNAPLKEDMARAALVAGARRRRGGDVPGGDGAARGGRLRAVRDLECGAPGRRSRHNIKYWTDGEWLGFGCGAHSTRDGVRWKNVSATEDYIERIGSGRAAAVDVRRLSDAERLGDALFTGLRLSDGVDEIAIERRYGVDVWERYGAELQPFWTSGC